MASLDYPLRKTHFDGLELVPANLRLFQSEYEIAARMARGQGNLIDRMTQGIASIADRFDVVVLDPPPAPGAISLSVLRAANALVVDRKSGVLGKSASVRVHLAGCRITKTTDAVSYYASTKSIVK